MAVIFAFCPLLFDIDAMWGFPKKRVYLDHASATPVLPEAIAAVRETSALYGNPGAIHAEAVAAKRLLENSRERIARLLECKSHEIIFTSGLTESNNLAILGLARKMQMHGKDLSHTHWIVSSIEHASVLESFAEIERLGGKVTHVDPGQNGIVPSEKIKNVLRKETVLISIGWGNNEIGTIQPLREIALIVAAHEKAHGTTVLMHSDAGQAPLYLHPHVHTLGVDMLSFGSGKLYGPRGIGALYVSNRANLAPTVIGGGQERGLRSGTEEPALAAGFATAFAIVAKEREGESRRLRELRDTFAKNIVEKISGAIVNGDLKRSLPHMLNISIPDISSEYLTLQLDRAGIAISTKSACNEGESSSHVVAALGGEEWRAKNTLRFSLGRGTRARELEATLTALLESAKKTR